MPVGLKGFEDVSRMLTEVTPKAAKAYLVKCAKPAAQVVIDAMANTVPVGIGILEEQLVAKTRWSSDFGGETLEIEIGPTKHAFWGMFQEFGTSKMPGKHWMSRAWSGCKDEVLNVFVDNIRELTSRLIKRDMSEATLENDEMDRASGHTTPQKFARDRRAAYRENKKRNG